MKIPSYLRFKQVVVFSLQDIRKQPSNLGLIINLKGIMLSPLPTDRKYVPKLGSGAFYMTLFF